MAEPASKVRAAFKFVFWTTAAVAAIVYVAQSHRSGKLAEWYYHTAATDGYAIDADTFMEATPDRPALLDTGKHDRIVGRMAVRVQKGERLPANANGVIGLDVLKQGKRAKLEAGQVTVMVPWEILMAKGFKFKDTFKHKGIKTYPWGAAWNVAMTLGIGLALGFMAEGFTDLLGIKLEKIRHFEGH